MEGVVDRFVLLAVSPEKLSEKIPKNLSIKFAKNYCKNMPTVLYYKCAKEKRAKKVSTKTLPNRRVMDNIPMRRPIVRVREKRLNRRRKMKSMPNA